MAPPWVVVGVVVCQRGEFDQREKQDALWREKHNWFTKLKTCFYFLSQVYLDNEDSSLYLLTADKHGVMNFQQYSM